MPEYVYPVCTSKRSTRARILFRASQPRSRRSLDSRRQGRWPQPRSLVFWTTHKPWWLRPSKYLAYAVQGFFQNGGVRCYILRLPPEVQGDGKGVNRFPAGTSAASLLRSLDAFSDVSIVCCPDEHSIAGMTAALIAHCEEMRYGIAVLSAPQGSDVEDAPVADARSAFAAYYAPWVMVPNPDGGADLRVHPGGHIAGAIVRNDLERGVAYAPANLQVLGITALERQFTKQQQEMLNQPGVNLLRSFPDAAT